MANHLQLAIEEVDRKIEQLQETRRHLQRALGIGGPPVKRQMSAEGRAKIAAAQQKRWAKVKKAAKSATK